MKICSPFIKSLIITLFGIVCISSCNNEKQTVVDELLRLITKATVEMQDLNDMQVRQLKDIPQNLQDSLALLQNRHPDVVLTEEDNEKIQAAMSDFTAAQKNAIKVFSNRIEMLQKSVARLNGENVGDEEFNDSSNNETSYSYATFF